MSKLIDLAGKKFGRLTVIERAYPERKCKQANWLCKCDCGIEKIIIGESLRNGNTQSCGCLRNERVKEAIGLNLGQSNMRALMSCYKNRAKKRGYIFDLTEEQFFSLTQKDCYYCGAKPNNISKYLGCSGDYLYNGIDRINNNGGYTIDNVVPCCKICNMAKNNLTLQEYKDWIKRSYNKMFGEEK